MRQKSLYEKASGVDTVGGRTFFVEVWERDRDPDKNLVDSQVWIVSRTNPKHRVRLPIPPSQSVFSFSRFVASPDERVLFAAHKRYSGANIIYVFTRTSPLHYRLADPVSLNERVGRKYGWPPDKSDPDHKYNSPLVDFVLFQIWQADNRDALFSCHYGPRSKGVFYLVTFNPRTGALSHYQKFDAERILPSLDGDRFPQTGFRLLTPAECAALSPCAAQAAIGEMLARRGSKNGVGRVEIRAAMFATERENLALLERALAKKTEKAGRPR